MPNVIILLACLILASLLPVSASAASSPFDVPELTIQPSPTLAQALPLDHDATVVDLEVAPDRPEAAVIVQDVTGRQKLLFWSIGTRSRLVQTIDVPKNISLSTIAWHPLGKMVFLLSHAVGQTDILATDMSGWHPRVLYTSHSPLQRLIVSARPFAIGSPIAKYRLFFGVERPDGTFSTHTITESGEREYAVLESKKNSVHLSNDGEGPNSIIVSDALPERFHPAGHFMVWENGQHCFQKAVYANNNWNEKPENLYVSKSVCDGSIAYTPNGAALLHWRSGKDGIELLYDHGQHFTIVAGGIRFLSLPSSVPDGRGVVGVTVTNNHETISYIPVTVPLADVANAWMYLQSSRDRELFTKNTGLFRSLDQDDQLYQLYDTETYACGHGYNETVPTRPYLVSTDIFWELYASAFEGIFILSERELAIPAFWDFVTKADAALHFDHRGSKVANVFSTLIDIHHGKIKPGSEADKIIRSKGISHSLLSGDLFDYGNLKPRSHYVTDAELQNYFRASKYLMSFEFKRDDIKILESLPPEIRKRALAWIRVYEPFIAHSRNHVIWDHNVIPAYVQYPSKAKKAIFPQSWGIDNEVLYDVVYDRISNPQPRLLPTSLDFPAVLGSDLAGKILEQSGEYSRYPSLKAKIADLRVRLGKLQSRQKPAESLYERWLAGLAIQWADEVTSPKDVIQKQFWQRKRLQTGLASWATLRHSTVLVNERTGAECGENGFEEIVLTPPRGYVEPDPHTFEAIAKLFNATIALVKSNRLLPKNVNSRNSLATNDLQEGIIRRLTESRERVRVFRDIAIKEIQGKPLSNQDYEDILYVGRAAEHNLLVFKSLANKDFALSTPDPITKIVDVAGTPLDGLLLVGVGRPVEWDQVVPFFGRKEVVKGVTYSYYDLTSFTSLNDKEWTKKIKTLSRPAWIVPYFSHDVLSCPATDP